MKTSENEFISNKFNYANSHVGGKTKLDNDPKYINSQANVIKNRNIRVPERYKPPYGDMVVEKAGLFGERFPPKDRFSLQTEQKNNDNESNKTKGDRFDPYGFFLNQKGLMDRDNISRYNTYYLNVDSTFRQTIPVPILGTPDILQNNPLVFTEGSSTLLITDPSNSYAVNDRITIENAIGTTNILKINATNILSFTNGSNYLTINYPHGMSFVTSPAPTDNNTPKTSDLFVTISGIRGYTTTTYIYNIPISTLNGPQRIYLINPASPSTPYSDNIFYIQLITAFTGPTNSFMPTPQYNITLQFNYIAGIPLNIINSSYPVGPNNLFGYKTINALTSTGYQITIFDEDGLLRPATALPAGITSAGGPSMTTTVITDLNSGYPDANNYLIDLDKTYSNVVLVRMVSSEFPNSQTAVVGYAPATINNLLYWENQEDGSTLYSISVTPGDYSAKDLAHQMTKQISQVQRITSPASLGTGGNTTYLTNNDIQVNINKDTNIVTFTSYNQAQVVRPFVGINPPISMNNPIPATSYVLTISQQNHGLSPGDTVIISGALSYFGIPTYILNTSHVVTSVINVNSYTITVGFFNLHPPIEDNGGGYAVLILTPNMFRLRFDLPNTIGTILGFRLVGQPQAITPFASTINNTQAYQDEPLVNALGQPVTIRNNALSLAGNDYILVVCPQIPGLFSQGTITQAFAKILLHTDTGGDELEKRLFNTFVSTPLYFFQEITNLSMLQFTFYSPDGSLYDFDGLDHSFTLEITTLAEIPKGTGIMATTGVIN